MRKLLLPFLSLLLVFCFSQPSKATTHVFDTSDNQFDAGVDNQGWWSGTRVASDTNANYAAGRDHNAHVLRNFFTFDLSSLAETAVSVTLQVRRYNYASATNQPSQTIEFFDVSTDAATLNNNVATSAAIFDDLGTGKSYGAFVVSQTGGSVDVLNFSLNADAVADINAAAGGWFSIGGTNVSIGAAGRELLFESSSGLDVQRLVVETAPATAGAVPDGGTVPGTPLTVSHGTAGSLVLAWGASCVSTDDDYAVYEGTLGDFTSHVPVACGTGGAMTVIVTPMADSAYYLVVPTNGVSEGSLGRDSGGAERSQGPTTCYALNVYSCS
jgi:hypothetical protein